MTLLFTHTNKYYDKYPKLIRKEVNGIRWYSEDSKLWMPSVTTVISTYNKDKFTEWRKRKGEERANQICKRSTDRGTKLHKIIEYFIKNKKYTSLPEWNDTKVQWIFKSIREHIALNIDMIYAQEQSMCSSKLRIAGTPDIVGEVNNELSIIDIKGSDQIKKEEWLTDYYVQMSFYWAMFVELTGLVPRQLVIFMFSEQMEHEIFIEKNIMKYLTIGQKYLRMFQQLHPNYASQIL